MKVIDGLFYTKEHEWVHLEEDNTLATIGITDFAQEQLGDVTFVDLPPEGTEVETGNTFGVVESVKSVSDLYAPVTGKILEINKPLTDAPQIVNEDPYQEGWMIKVQTKNVTTDDLMSSEDYKKYIAEENA